MLTFPYENSSIVDKLEYKKDNSDNWLYTYIRGKLGLLFFLKNKRQQSILIINNNKWVLTI